MKFNNFVWSLYKTSPAGQLALAKRPEEYQAVRSDELHADEKARDAIVLNNALSSCASKTVNTSEQARELYESLVDNTEEVFANIGAVSLALHSAFPTQFVPYLFTRRFNVFEVICVSFGIPLLPLPKRPQERERSMYYLAINDALQQFRHLHGLAPHELTAFLYDYAQKVIAADIGKELPPPTSMPIPLNPAQS